MRTTHTKIDKSILDQIKLKAFDVAYFLGRRISHREIVDASVHVAFKHPDELEAVLKSRMYSSPDADEA